MASSDLEVGVVTSASTRELRRRILRPNLSRGDALPGDDQPDAVHIGALDGDGGAAGACIIYAEPCLWLPGRPAWHLRQMATDERRRGQGVGARVVTFASTFAREQGADVLWCNARETAVGFYQRSGFTGHGDIFTDERHPIPHLRMWQELSDRPASSL